MASRHTVAGTEGRGASRDLPEVIAGVAVASQLVTPFIELVDNVVLAADEGRAGVGAHGPRPAGDKGVLPGFATPSWHYSAQNTPY